MTWLKNFLHKCGLHTDEDLELFEARYKLQADANALAIAAWRRELLNQVADCRAWVPPPVVQAPPGHHIIALPFVFPRGQEPPSAILAGHSLALESAHLPTFLVAEGHVIGLWAASWTIPHGHELLLQDLRIGGSPSLHYETETGEGIDIRRFADHDLSRHPPLRRTVKVREPNNALITLKLRGPDRDSPFERPRASFQIYVLVLIKEEADDPALRGAIPYPDHRLPKGHAARRPPPPPLIFRPHPDSGAWTPLQDAELDPVSLEGRLEAIQAELIDIANRNSERSGSHLARHLEATLARLAHEAWWIRCCLDHPMLEEADGTLELPPNSEEVEAS